ncbi:putative structural component [Pseudomonas phage POR1]|uniref:Putative structural component n=1 Tax=Pseudomonas phage POR1 TaxID=1718594 RepID=A0A0N9SSD8_9CAUD|nr:putative structural component [Pseudomonas phage POR1]
MAAITFNAKHVDTLWNNWHNQFNTKPKLEAFFKGLAKPMEGIEAAYAQMLQARGVDTAVGAQLDGVGNIVGQERYVPGAFLIPFFGYEEQRATTGYNQARYRRIGESNEDESGKMTDADYALLIKWKIVVNSSNGTIPDVIKAMRALFPNAVKVKVTEPGVRQMNVEVITPTTPNPIFATNLEAFVPKMGGIRVTATARQGTA